MTSSAHNSDDEDESGGGNGGDCESTTTTAAAPVVSSSSSVVLQPLSPIPESILPSSTSSSAASTLRRTPQAQHSFPGANNKNNNNILNHNSNNNQNVMHRSPFRVSAASSSTAATSTNGHNHNNNNHGKKRSRDSALLWLLSAIGAMLCMGTILLAFSVPDVNNSHGRNIMDAIVQGLSKRQAKPPPKPKKVYARGVPAKPVVPVQTESLSIVLPAAADAKKTRSLRHNGKDKVDAAMVVGGGTDQDSMALVVAPVVKSPEVPDMTRFGVEADYGGLDMTWVQDVVDWVEPNGTPHENYHNSFQTSERHRRWMVTERMIRKHDATLYNEERKAFLTLVDVVNAEDATSAYYHNAELGHPRSCERPVHSHDTYHYPACNPFHELSLERPGPDAEMLEPPPDAAAGAAVAVGGRRHGHGHLAVQRIGMSLAEERQRLVSIHQEQLQLYPIHYLTSGFYRNVFSGGIPRLPTHDGKKHNKRQEAREHHEDDFVLKTIRLQGELEFSQKQMRKTFLEALTMERLHTSKYMANIYGHCSTSILMEKMVNDLAPLVVPEEANTTATDTTTTTTADHGKVGAKKRAEQLKRELEARVAAANPVTTEVQPRNNWTNMEKLDAAISMASALAEMHGYRDGVMIHHEVLPEQWGISRSGQIKLIDANNGNILMWSEENKTYCKTWKHFTFGTLKSPEEFRGAFVGPEVDVWAFGHTLYALLTGSYPFHKETDHHAVREMIRRGAKPYVDDRYRRRSFIEERLVEIMEECWEFEPERRVDIFHVLAELRETKKAQKDPNHGKRRYEMKLGGLVGDVTKGTVIIETHLDWAPIGVKHFHRLVEARYFDQCRFFHTVPNFMVQFGIAADPIMTEQWKNEVLKDDAVIETNRRGTIGYATVGKDSRTTQLFINTKVAGNSFLDGQGFAPIAEIVEGMQYIDMINTEYGEKPGPGKTLTRGNAYLNEEFPRLSYIESIRQIPLERGGGKQKHHEEEREIQHEVPEQHGAVVGKANADIVSAANNIVPAVKNSGAIAKEAPAAGASNGIPPVKAEIPPVIKVPIVAVTPNVTASLTHANVSKAAIVPGAVSLPNNSNVISKGAPVGVAPNGIAANNVVIPPLIKASNVTVTGAVTANVSKAAITPVGGSLNGTSALNVGNQPAIKVPNVAVTANVSKAAIVPAAGSPVITNGAVLNAAPAGGAPNGTQNASVAANASGVIAHVQQVDVSKAAIVPGAGSVQNTGGAILKAEVTPGVHVQPAVKVPNVAVTANGTGGITHVQQVNVANAPIMPAAAASPVNTTTLKGVPTGGVLNGAPPVNGAIPAVNKVPVVPVTTNASGGLTPVQHVDALQAAILPRAAASVVNTSGAVLKGATTGGVLNGAPAVNAAIPAVNKVPIVAVTANTSGGVTPVQQVNAPKAAILLGAVSPLNNNAALLKGAPAAGSPVVHDVIHAAAQVPVNHANALPLLGAGSPLNNGAAGLKGASTAEVPKGLPAGAAAAAIPAVLKNANAAGALAQPKIGFVNHNAANPGFGHIDGPKGVAANAAAGNLPDNMNNNNRMNMNMNMNMMSVKKSNKKSNKISNKTMVMNMSGQPRNNRWMRMNDMNAGGMK